MYNVVKEETDDTRSKIQINLKERSEAGKAKKVGEMEE